MTDTDRLAMNGTLIIGGAMSGKRVISNNTWIEFPVLSDGALFHENNADHEIGTFKRDRYFRTVIIEDDVGHPVYMHEKYSKLLSPAPIVGVLLDDIKRLRAEIEELTETTAALMGPILSDTDRINWIGTEVRKNGTVRFERYGRSWMDLFSVSSQHTQQKPDVRTLIDHAIELSKERGYSR